MSKSTTKKSNTGRLEERMWRVNQRAHKFTDRKKAESKKACRKGGWD
jgi:hypothetical protein